MDKKKDIVIIGAFVLIIGIIYVYYKSKKKQTVVTNADGTTTVTQTTDPVATTIDQLFGNTPVTVSSESYQQLLSNQPIGHDGGFGDPKNPIIPFSANFTINDLPTYISPNGKKLKFFVYSNLYPSVISKQSLYNNLSTSGPTYTSYIGAIDTNTNIFYPVNLSTAKANGFTDNITDIVIADDNFIKSLTKYAGTGTDYGNLNNNQII